MNSLYAVATIVAAMLCGFGFVLQQNAAEKVRSSQFMRLGLIAKLIHNRRWIAGIAVLVAGDLVSAWALGHIDLSIAEPLLTTNLIFALLLAVPLSGQMLRRTEIIGAILLTAGVAALSLTRSVKAPGESFGSFSHWYAAGIIAVIALILVRMGRRRSGVARAALIGTASGLFFGIADAFTRLSVQVLDGRHPLELLVHWPGYATVVASVIGLWLMQNAFNAAPLHASLPAVTAAEPAAGIVLGVLVFGDVVHVTPWLLALQLAGVVAMVGGVILVARAPVFRDLHLGKLPHVALDRLQHPPPVHGPDTGPNRSSQPGGEPDSEVGGSRAAGPDETRSDDSHAATAPRHDQHGDGASKASLPSAASDGRIPAAAAKPGHAK